MFNDTITVYNRYKDGQTEQWARTVLSGVFWSSSRGAVTRKTGVSAADGVMIVIPKKSVCGYSPPHLYAGVGFTFRPGDVIVKGESTQEVTRSPSELITNHAEVLTITHVDDRDFGAAMEHWEVSGK